MDENDRRQRAAAEAAHWMVRLQSGSAQRDEREQFIDWLRESQLHVAEMLRVSQVHATLENVDFWGQISIEGSRPKGPTVTELPVRRPTPKRHRSLRFVTLAASLGIVTAAYLFALPLILGKTIETARGERREVVLSDGSILQVDPETRLRVKYNDAARQIFLDAGRAVFHVASNPQQPFVVQADETTVRAVGTIFGVDTVDNNVVVTVLEGSVAVNEKAISVRQPRDPTAPVSRILIAENQQIAIASGTGTPPVHEVDSHRELSWAEGRLVFQNEVLSSVIEKFNRYNSVRLKVTDAALANRHVSGVFNASEPEAFIAFLKTVTPLDIVRDGNRSILIGPAQKQ
jgi:transmembrane sensor